jgi:gas vesicle protein
MINSLTRKYKGRNEKMEEKTFKLLEKLYVEMQKGLSDVRSEMQKGLSDVRSEMQKGFSDVRSEMKEGFQEVNQRFTVLENKVDVNLKALYDGYSLNTEAINRLEKKVDVLTEKVDSHDIEIKVIRNAK